MRLFTTNAIETQTQYHCNLSFFDPVAILRGKILLRFVLKSANCAREAETCFLVHVQEITFGGGDFPVLDFFCYQLFPYGIFLNTTFPI